MKKNSALIVALLLGATLAQAQTPSGQSAGSSGKSVGSTGTSSPNRSQPAVPSGSQQTGAQQGGARTTTGTGTIGVNPVDESRQRVLLDTQNRVGGGGTNQASVVDPVPFDPGRYAPTNLIGRTNTVANGTNQIRFGATNGAVPFSPGANPDSTAGNGAVVFDAAGAAASQSRVSTPANTGVNIQGQPVGTGPAGVTGQGGQHALSGVNDPAFTARMEAALASTGSTRVFFPQTQSNIQVMNQNGTVTLQGNVASAAERQSIEARVKAMRGVKTINNELLVTPAGNATRIPSSPAVPTP